MELSISRRILPKLLLFPLFMSTLSLLGQNTVTIDTGGSPTATLSDWQDETLFPDDLCDDFPNQQDVTGVGIASNWVNPGPATTIYLRFDFDDTTVSGANTLDGCWLVDTDQDGNVNRGLCFSLGGSPVDLVSTRFFTCNDSTTSTCAGDVEVFGSSASCAVNSGTTGADLFPVCPGPDTGVECSVSLTDLGWAAGVVRLLQGCSSTSAQPNSATFDCIPGLIIDPATGTIHSALSNCA